MTEKAPPRIFATVNGSSTSLPDGKRSLIGGWSDCAGDDRATEYVRADLALSAVEGVKPRVKELEWREVDLSAAKPPMVIWEAKTPFMTYTFESIMGRPWFCHFICAHFNDIEVGKAAIQADYEKRTLSALEGE